MNINRIPEAFSIEQRKEKHFTAHLIASGETELQKKLSLTTKAHLNRDVSPAWLQLEQELQLLQLLVQSRSSKNSEVFTLLHSHFSKTSQLLAVNAKSLLLVSLTPKLPGRRL